MNVVLEVWKNSIRYNISRRWEIVPSNSESNSIFSLKVEFPRYRSLLLGMPSKNLEDLDLAWESYYQEKYKIKIREKAIERVKEKIIKHII